MKHLKALAVVVSILALAVAGPTVKAKDKTPGRITVSFGTGNNNAQAGSKPNHHIVPQEFKVRITKARNLQGEIVAVPAVVNFVVSGFHWVWVYQPGVRLDDVVAQVPAAGTFVNFDVDVFAKGVFPGTPQAIPPFSDGGPFPLSGTQNRTDSIAFSAPGKYLVICNVRGHFLDGMYAWVRVVDDDDDDDDHGGHGE